MATDASEELAYMLQIQEFINSDDRVGKPDKARKFTASDYCAMAADARRHKQELQLYEDLSKMRSEKPIKPQQLWQDEEIARGLDDEQNDGDVSNSSGPENEVFDLFFAQSDNDDGGYVGVGCVIKDAEGQVVFQNREYIGIVSRHFAEYTALVNGLAFARSTGVKQLNAHGNRPFIYWEVEGQAEAWTAEQLNSMDALIKQIKQLDGFSIHCVPRAENKDAIKLANYAVEHELQIKRNSPLENKVDDRKQCLICLENVFPSDMVCQKACNHSFCFDCLSHHVETEIAAGKVPVRCPQYECARNMGPDDCRRLISPKVFDTYSSRLTEATISDSEKVYCPFSGCSAMMCRSDENNANTNAARPSDSTKGRTLIASAECMECHRLFCVECQVPWHAKLTCQQYQQLPPDERGAEDRKLFQLAKDQKWRRCGKCRSLIILAEGCFHMTCRCGNEFCYTCGTDYRNRRQVCKCPLFHDDYRQAARQYRWFPALFRW